jgi:hypothetical protein
MISRLGLDLSKLIASTLLPTVRNHLRDFEDSLLQKLEGLHGMYAGNVLTIGGLCAPVLIEDPFTGDYLCWLSKEIFGLPDMFSGVKKFRYSCN